MNPLTKSKHEWTIAGPIVAPSFFFLKELWFLGTMFCVLFIVWFLVSPTWKACRKNIKFFSHYNIAFFMLLNTFSITHTLRPDLGLDMVGIAVVILGFALGYPIFYSKIEKAVEDVA